MNPAAVTFVFEGTINESFNITIPAGRNATQKRQDIIAGLKAKGYEVKEVGVAGDDPFGLDILALPSGQKVTFKPGATGEGRDRLLTTTPVLPGAIFQFGFQNTTFDPLDTFGNPALFSGGFVTDLGSLIAEVSSTELSSTSGTAIVQALFNELVGSAPAFGATVENRGDFVDITTLIPLTFGGVIFGTTSLTEGAFGSIQATDIPEPGGLPLAGGAVLALALWRRYACA
jgi:hypothetical protein